jgi:nitrite reductase (NADH) small subunit
VPAAAVTNAPQMQGNGMTRLISVAKVDEIPAGTGKEVVVGDRIIAIYHVGGQFYALDGICPHAGGPLGEGSLSGPIVTCPWHGWQFDVRTGQSCLNAKIRHPSFPVTIDGNEILVDVGR